MPPICPRLWEAIKKGDCDPFMRHDPFLSETNLVDSEGLRRRRLVVPDSCGPYHCDVHHYRVADMFAEAGPPSEHYEHFEHSDDEWKLEFIRNYEVGAAPEPGTPPAALPAFLAQPVQTIDVDDDLMPFEDTKDTKAGEAMDYSYEPAAAATPSLSPQWSHSPPSATEPVREHPAIAFMNEIMKAQEEVEEKIRRGEAVPEDVMHITRLILAMNTNF